MSLYDQEGRSHDSLKRSKGFNKTMITKSILRLEEEGIVCRNNRSGRQKNQKAVFYRNWQKLKPDMERIGFEINEFLLKGFDSDEFSSAIEVVRKITLNAARL